MLTCTIILCFGKRIFFGFDRSKDHSKTNYFLGFVLVLPKQKTIVQVRIHVLIGNGGMRASMNAFIPFTFIHCRGALQLGDSNGILPKSLIGLSDLSEVLVGIVS